MLDDFSYEFSANIDKKRLFVLEKPLLLTINFDNNLMNDQIRQSLKELGFSTNEAKVYLALTVLGEARASEVGKKADLPRTTVISILERLKSDNFITTHVFHGRTYYWIESPKAISNLLHHRIEVVDKISSLLTNLYRNEAHFPVAKICDTKSKIKNEIEKMIANLPKGSIIYTIDTPKSGNYSKIFSQDSEESMYSLKKKKDLVTYTLVPYQAKKGISVSKTGAQNIIIKEMPKGLEFSGSLWVVGDEIANFSGNPPFLVIVRHADIVRGIKGIFDFLWNVSIS